MRVGVIGTGQFGLVTAVTLADVGHDVAALDVDAETIETLRRSEAPFYEPGLQERLVEQVAAGRLSSGRADFRLAGTERRTDHHARRREPDALALLRRRSRRGAVGGCSCPTSPDP
jgi:3-hydroxyacyl-CoA dehydrogenase